MAENAESTLRASKNKMGRKWMEMRMRLRNGVRLRFALFRLRLFCLKYSSGCLYLPACQRMHSAQSAWKVYVSVCVWKSRHRRYMISVFIWCIILKHPWLKWCFSCYVWLCTFLCESILSPAHRKFGCHSPFYHFHERNGIAFWHT